MLKPSDMIGSNDLQDSLQRAQIEDHIDEALKRSDKTNEWPCLVGTTRAGWSPDLIAAVLLDYARAGWVVVSGGRDTMCVLDKPRKA